jgi:phosphotransacetylase
LFLPIVRQTHPTAEELAQIAVCTAKTTRQIAD